MTPNATAGPAGVASFPHRRDAVSEKQLPTHVLQLGPYPPPHGGVQSNIVAIRNYLRTHGARSSVINLTRFRQPDADDVYYPRSAWALAKLLLRERSQIIHLHIGGDLKPRLLLLGLLCTSLPWAKTVLTFHSGGFPSSTRGRRTRRNGFTAAVLRRFDRVIAVNQEIAAFFARLGCDASRIRCIRPDAIPSIGDVDDAPGTLARQVSDFLARSDPALVTVGGLEPEYDLPLQVELIGRLLARHPRAGLAIIGSGSRAIEIERLIASRPWAHHVALCGDVPHAITLRAIAAARVVLRTTHYDGDSIAVREAMHLGTPVIASDNGMRPEGVRLVRARDLDALEVAVEATLAEPPPSREQRASTNGDDPNIVLVANIYRELSETPAPQMTPVLSARADFGGRA